MTPVFSNWLNFFRWTAAFLVVIGHLRHIVFVDYKGVIEKNLTAKGMYFITGLGHEAVMMFFVISGLLVGGLTLQKWQSQMHFGEYLINRISRIYTVFIPALVIGAGLDWVGIHYFNQLGIYTAGEQFRTVSTNFNSENRLTSNVFMANIAMLQSIVVPSLGSNGPLWSLAYEWWYYLLFAGLLGGHFSKNLQVKVVLWILSGVMLTVLPIKLTLWMSIWLMGVAVFLYGQSNLPKPPVWLGFVVFMSVLLVSRLSHNQDNVLNHEPLYVEFIRDAIFGLGFSFLLLSLYGNGPGKTLDSKFSAVNALLSNFSYSVYLFHFPFLLLMISIVNKADGSGILGQPAWNSFLGAAAMLVAIYIYSYVMSLISERYTSKIRKVLKQRFVPRVS